MNFSSAYDMGRALQHGWAALKRAPGPMFVGAFLMNCTEGGGGGGNIPTGGGGNGGGFPWEQQGGGSNDGDADLMLQPLFEGGDRLLAGQAPDLGQIMGELGGLGAGLIALAIVMVLALVLVLVVFRAWLSVGWLRLHKEILELGTGNWSTLFSGGDRVWDMLVLSLLTAAVSLGAMVASGLPGGALAIAGGVMKSQGLIMAGGALILVIMLPVLIYVSLGLALAQHHLVFDDAAPTEALRKSWASMDDNRFHFFIFAIVLNIFRAIAGVVGICLLCVGALVTGPVARAMVDLGATEAFLLFTRSEEETKQWSIWSFENS